MKKALITLALGTLISTNALSSVITYENRYSDSGVDKNDYQASWNNQGSAVQSWNLDSFTNLKASGNHRHSHLNISFDVSTNNAGLDWWFQFSPDAGHGGEIYFDGNLVERDSSNLWWGYNWNNTSELLQALATDVNEGTHTIDLYWAENCCNGKQAGRFSVNQGTSWHALSTENLDAVGVPEPGSLALLALGVAGLIATRRSSK